MRIKNPFIIFINMYIYSIFLWTLQKQTHKLSISSCKLCTLSLTKYKNCSYYHPLSTKLFISPPIRTSTSTLLHVRGFISHLMHSKGVSVHACIRTSTSVLCFKKVTKSFLPVLMQLNKFKGWTHYIIRIQRWVKVVFRGGSKASTLRYLSMGIFGVSNFDSPL